MGTLSSDKMRTFFVVLFLYIAVVNCAEDEKPSRKPKLFFASTLYTSTTISTSAVCFVPSFFTSSAILGWRKKQLSFLEKDDVKTVDYSINPTSLNEAKDVDTPLEKEESEGEREGKQFFYYATYTETRTSTSITATSKIASLLCTPRGWDVPMCLGK